MKMHMPSPKNCQSAAKPVQWADRVIEEDDAGDDYCYPLHGVPWGQLANLLV